VLCLVQATDALMHSITVQHDCRCYITAVWLKCDVLPPWPFSGLSVGLTPCPIATLLSLTIRISAASIELPGLSALPKTRFPIAGSVCPVGQWRNLKMLRSLRSPKREGYPV